MANNYISLGKTIVLAVLSLISISAYSQTCPALNTCATPPGTATNGLAPILNAGIYAVKIGTQTFASGGYAEGFRDSSCTLGGTIFQGQPDSLVVTTGGTINENVRAWVDWNNDGIFDAGSEQVVTSNTAKRHAVLVTPPPTALLNQKLRLRIASDGFNYAVPSPCSTPEVGQTEDYFIIVSPNTAPPIASFFTGDTVTCTGVVRFTNQSTGSNNTYLWRFGDGMTSNQTTPQHVYASSGVFSVTLVVSNPNGIDSLVRTNYINFSNLGPVAATCSPITLNYCCGYGITRFSITDIRTGLVLLNKTSANGSAGYEDFTCQSRASLTGGRYYYFTLATSPNNDQTTRIWLDTNANGAFEAAEVIYTSVNQRSPADSVYIPNGGRLNRPLRMRIYSDGSTTLPTGCTQPSLGQVEDYTITLLPNTSPPMASFYAINSSGCDSVRQFVNTSENAITRLVWDFGDGDTLSTTVDTVTHAYNAPGNYTVSLTAYGPFGQDSLTMPGVVTYFQGIAPACSIVTARFGGGIGIRRVRLNSIDVSSGDASEGYRDFTCQAITNLFVGNFYPINLTVGQQNNETARVYIDFNNSATFETSELVATLQGTGILDGSIEIPLTATLNTPLRMRIYSHATQAQQPVDPCNTNLAFGQGEDYAVVLLANTAPPIAGFGAEDRVTCNGLVTFYDSSQNRPTLIRYHFGDGTSIETMADTIEHTYTAVGSYTVTQVVFNAYGSDSLVRTGLITVLQNNGLKLAPCRPVTTNHCCGAGVTNVTFNTISNASANGSVGYQDFACTQTTTVQAGNSYNFSVTVGAQVAGVYAVWIDLDSSGTFELSERLLTGQGTGTLSGVITIPATAPVLGTALRMRVYTDLRQGGPGGNLPTDACQNVQFGQVEDYSVIVSATPDVPIARFGAVSRTSCDGFVSFTDSSQNRPVRYLWNFGDGTTDTTRGNVRHRYTVAGVYTVSLRVQNSLGADSLTRTSFVTVSLTDSTTPTTCLPRVLTTVANMGITSAWIAGIQNTTTAQSTYTDYACERQSSSSINGSQFNLIVTVANRQGGEWAYVWLDYNDDGIYQQAERIFASMRPAFQHNISVPSGYTAVANRPLRLRIISSQVNLEQSSACDDVFVGEVEDYRIVFTNSAPQAGLATYPQNGVSCNGTIHFKDASLFVPTSWRWNFGDGDTSNLQNPSHTYSAPGTYTVTLTVSNATGASTSTTSVAVSSRSGTRATECAPFTVMQTQNTAYGITNLQFFNTRTGMRINRQSAGAVGENYYDGACTDSVSFRNGDQISVTLQQVSFQIQQYLRVFVDANNNGIMENNEVVYRNDQVAPRLTINFIVPVVSGSNRARLRFQAGRAGTYDSTNMCRVTDGQAEDFTLALEPVSIKNLTYLKGVSAFPNPSTGKVQVQASFGHTGRAAVRLYGADGRLLEQRDMTHSANALTEPLDISNYAKGLYWVEIITGTQQSRICISRQ